MKIPKYHQNFLGSQFSSQLYSFFFFNKFIYVIYLFLAALGLRCHAGFL